MPGQVASASSSAVDATDYQVRASGSVSNPYGRSVTVTSVTITASDGTSVSYGVNVTVPAGGTVSWQGTVDVHRASGTPPPEPWGFSTDTAHFTGC